MCATSVLPSEANVLSQCHANCAKKSAVGLLHRRDGCACTLVVWLLLRLLRNDTLFRLRVEAALRWYARSKSGTSDAQPGILDLVQNSVGRCDRQPAEDRRAKEPLQERPLPRPCLRAET
jgi:hypothetical protein